MPGDADADTSSPVQTEWERRRLQIVICPTKRNSLEFVNVDLIAEGFIPL